ncbi:galactosylceramide sulfotransferase-like [Tigriopus californicus]|uniref:galactosylceramide sulfotransferase-like n=1 Tax=Tigriopus californicus TaxID=6832 RepID=UPI0027DA6A5E|nr:galactosylceramide sulfotransferase-like [Tigriopus californicus]
MMNRRQYVEYTRFQPESSMQRKLGSESLFLTKSEKNADLNKVIAKNQIIGTRQCQPKRKFGFMKTHKTGSSNVQHRLLVYAYRNDVNVILPQTGNYVNNPKHKYVLDEPFRLEWLNGVSWHRDFVKNNEYGIQALHTKWNYTAYRTLLGPSAVFSTILRNPVHTFESQYSYYGFESHYRMNISEYLKR